MQGNLIASSPTAVSQGSFHVAGGGTSAASPVVAGLAALLWEAHPTYNNVQVRQAILNCTYKDGFTGTALPNYKWGYGKLDGFSTFTCIIAAGMDENKTHSITGNAYPDPFNEQTVIKLNQEYNGTVKIFSSRPNSPQSYQEAWDVLNDYSYQDNHQRLHAGIKYLRPADMFFGRGQQVLTERKSKIETARSNRKQKNLEDRLKNMH